VALINTNAAWQKQLLSLGWWNQAVNGKPMNGLKNKTALTELLAIDLNKVGKNQVYTIADRLLAQKEFIERSLRETEINLFSMNQTLFLYDITNTYFEGRCVNNSLSKRGHSKEKGLIALWLPWLY